jgi:hypothetical protein
MFLAEYGACRQRVANYGRIYGVLYQSCSPSRRDGIGERRFRNAVVHTSLTLMPCGVATNDECAIHDGVLGAISPVGCTFAAILSVRTDFTPVYTTPGTPASDKQRFRNERLRRSDARVFCWIWVWMRRPRRFAGRFADPYLARRHADTRPNDKRGQAEERSRGADRRR